MRTKPVMQAGFLLMAAKAGTPVKEGDVVEILFGTKSVKVEVLNTKETVKKDEAAEMYKEL